MKFYVVLVMGDETEKWILVWLFMRMKLLLEELIQS